MDCDALGGKQGATSREEIVRYVEVEVGSNSHDCSLLRLEYVEVRKIQWGRVPSYS